jgi:hypothetical protein
MRSGDVVAGSPRVVPGLQPGATFTFAASVYDPDFDDDHEWVMTIIRRPRRKAARARPGAVRRFDLAGEGGRP